MDVDIRGVAIGFTAAGLVLAGLIYVVGLDGVIAALGLLTVGDLLLLAGAAIAYLLAWGLALRVVLRAVGVPISIMTSSLLFASATFANNITPFGQAGGEPFSALLIARSTDSEYESALAAIASVDTINFIPSIALSAIGLSYYLAVVTVGDRLRVVALVVAGLAIGVPVAAYLIWRFRPRFERSVVRLLHPVVTAVARVVPSISNPGRTSIRRRVRGFFRAIERVADSPTTLAIALVFSTIGWAALAISLWIALAAVGYTVPIAAALIAAPVGAIASVTPLPGGLGGVELAIVVVVVPITAVSAEAAASAALVYRGGTYWLPTVLGGLATAWLEAKVGR